jgi:FMN-dependent NADH-azoreductase
VKLLEIQSSPGGSSSDSITLTKSFVEACKSDNTSIVVDRLNVWHERLPEFDYEQLEVSWRVLLYALAIRSPGNLFWTFGCSL